MLCEDCGKKEAKVEVTQMVKNEKTVLRLCVDCAKKRGFEDSLSTSSISLGNFLASIIQKSEAESTEPLPKIKCPGCNLDYAEFRQHGRLGCSRCYDTFFDYLKDLLRRIHGSNDHVGKVPRSAREKFLARRELKKLHQEMKRAVEREEFERAANLRDQIRKLELKEAGKAEGGGLP
jgi:protein arginine kinase activator